MNISRARKPAGGLPVRYLLVFWVLVLSALAFVDRTNISIAGVQISSEFKIDNAHLGWVFSAFLISYAAFQIPAGVLARKIGPRLLLTIGVVWWGLFTVLTALVPHGVRGALWMLILVRFSLGAGAGVMYPSANQFVERWFPMKERGKANGIVFGGVGLGSAVTPLLVTGITLRYGWHTAFWFCAVLGLLIGAIWYLIARDTPEAHPWVRAAELEHIVNGRGDVHDAAAIAAGRSHGAVPWMRLFSSRNVIALTVSYFTYGYISWIFFSWFYIYLAQVRGLSLKTSAVYSVMPFIAMTIGSLLGGVSSDWMAHHISARVGRCFLPAFALALTGALLLVGSRAHDAQTASIVLACGAGALYLSQSCFFSVTADFGGQHAGVVSGTMNMGCQIGGAVTASLTPLIASRFGWEASFLTATVLAALGALAWFAVDPSARLAAIEIPSADRSAPASAGVR
jgi:ACS family glucarate transporter-like MFS transporter